MDLTLRLKPSKIAQYFEKECDKYLVYYDLNRDDYARLEWNGPDESRQSGEAMAGNEWETILAEKLRNDRACDFIDLDDCSFAETVEALKNLENTGKTIYLYQSCLNTTESFNKRYLSQYPNSTAVTFGKMLPDFIRAEYAPTKKQFCLTVIDAKNASFLKVGAEIQVALYVMILKDILKDCQITNCYVNEEDGIVWNRESITDNCLEHPFDLKEAMSELETFFDVQMKAICEVIDNSRDSAELQNNLNVCIGQKCEFCDNFERCLNRCRETRSVRVLPYITAEAQKCLDELIANGTLADDTLDSVWQLLTDQPDELTQDCSFWKNIKGNLEAYRNGLTGLYQGERRFYPKEGSSISMACGQNFALFLTAQKEACSGRVYAYSWLLKPGKDLRLYEEDQLNDNHYVPIGETTYGRGLYFDSVIAKENTEQEFDNVDKLFVEAFFEFLQKISEYPELNKRRLQCYVMDQYELKNIEDTLYRMLESLDADTDRELLYKVTEILFFIQGERFVTESKASPIQCLENPVTVLTTEISRLYVLSEGVAYNLKKVASIFSPGFNFDQDSVNYFGVLSNVIESKYIKDAWENRNAENRERSLNFLMRHLRKRLFVEASVLHAIQIDRGNALSLWPKQYSMEEPQFTGYPEIGKLYFENLYEQLLVYRRIRSVRMVGIDQAIENGTILHLEYTGTGRTYRILNPENCVGNKWFTAWLCEDTPENRRQIMLLRDKNFRFINPCIEIRNSETKFYPADTEHDYNFTDDGENVTVEFRPKEQSGFAPVIGRTYLFFEVYMDFNSSKTAGALRELVNRPELLDPTALSGPTGRVADDAEMSICRQFQSSDGRNFSPSQENAFRHLFTQKLNVLVGPPASGKTDFIARSLITLCRYEKERNNRNMKVMVTAMSHSAIENVLLKLVKMLGPNGGDIHIMKAVKIEDQQAFAGSQVKLIEKQDIVSSMRKDEIQIYGMTAWAATQFSGYAFDLIVMDEASQVRTMDAFLNLECSNGETGFLLVGDDDQLPPIIGGHYRETEGEKYIYGSIFKMFLTGLGEGHPDIINLSDNFRMNEILCRYSSKALYGPGYRAANDGVAKQTISLEHRADDDLLASVLDEEFPLVFCELSGLSREQTEAEVRLVTELVRELMNSQINTATGHLASEDGNFWQDCNSPAGFLEGACGIISPHHEHINRLKTNIANSLGINRADIYIGTVDKLQGKERKTVIVSYGVSSPEKIRNESEFIFSRNRLNVSITRGKAKTIVILSDRIAEPSLSTNVMKANDEKLGKGISFVQGFAQFMKQQEEGEELVLEEYPCPYDNLNVSLRLWKKKIR